MVDRTCSCARSIKGSVDGCILRFGLHSDLLAYLHQILAWESTELSGPLLTQILHYTVSIT
jgi:hypothetical protein